MYFHNSWVITILKDSLFNLIINSQRGQRQSYIETEDTLVLWRSLTEKLQDDIDISLLFVSHLEKELHWFLAYLFYRTALLGIG